MTSNSESAISAAQPAPTTGPPDVIGTPLSPTATKVMVLGAGELGKEVVIAFQRLGVEVVAVDRYADAPGHQVAHHAEVIDMTDADALRAVVDKHRPAYVVPEIEAIATEALVDIAERGIAEVIPTASAVVATMNREGIRRLADEELGLPTSPYLFADTLEEVTVAARQIGFPCVIKPVMSSSGKGQSVVRGPEDLASAWETANTGGRVRGTRVIVEGFVEFDYEITLLTVRAIDPATGRLTSHFCAPIGHRQINGDYVESWQPHEMSSDAHASATSIAARIATALGDGKLAGRGVFGVELFVKGDDVYFSEVSPRPHDTGLVTMATQRLSEFEMHARAILGLPVDVTLASPGASAVIYGQLDEPAIGFENVAAALAVPETDIRLFGKPESFHRRRMGVITATADDVPAARERAVRAASLVTPVPGRAAVRTVTALPPTPPPTAPPRRPGPPPGPVGPPRGPAGPPPGVPKPAGGPPGPPPRRPGPPPQPRPVPRPAGGPRPVPPPSTPPPGTPPRPAGPPPRTAPKDQSPNEPAPAMTSIVKTGGRTTDVRPDASSTPGE
ncbi:formate-dependent phosphoribosylglycinamide formyltransferase [Gordonia terrae]|uniref:Formate-dependent phosphoribosylglycinamide formyltransferase n=2 Tax=Gordonia terrae TaxID=2055 RepID=A0AAD0KA04_9ACTN|nr:formate-dependent phosphoribosylglycinamide formyltransferase [Gordonia terrae]VTR07764.1 phosphoribosylaminoimidazole carboxylase ATPase subunit [Clostridioides difficile]ANY24936.1 phosphoribosylglycinamide formyltransferase 2 [Gordonia terrae]AWO85685.1 formate-dependent phosphoribosylglycinamide formyltransferase [Gordonia terrae]VTS60935.1 Phosphoribosylglycinamide formyltransferase 2 [Gordonia terrae]GAB43906.1 phosphoribosylglycinamide formyltransferase 2 [Gordonia terrae NBRC 100016